jgi:Na+/phosphate symporter
MNKKVAFRFLVVIDILLLLLGALFTALGIALNLKMSVMGSDIPVYVFGFVIIFLGIRYMKSIFKLKKRISPDASFSWDNFSKPFKGFLRRSA